MSRSPRSPPVVADATDDEAVFAVVTEEVPPPSERRRRAGNSLQSLAVPSSELIGSSDDGPPPSPSPRDKDDEHERAVSMLQQRGSSGWDVAGDPGGRRAIIPIEGSSVRQEQQQQPQVEQMNGNTLFTRARQLPAEVTL